MNIFILEFLGQVLSSRSTVQGIAILDGNGEARDTVAVRNRCGSLCKCQ